jgi:aspartate/methionine/tyrosine aminotransferase
MNPAEHGRVVAAQRALAMPPFHAMAMTAAAHAREAQGHRVLHLELGQPSTPAPAAARQAVVDALTAAQPLGYTGAAGLPALRERLACHDSVRSGREVSEHRIMVVAGASAGFTLAFLAAFDPGDRVVVLEPGYPCYRNALAALGVDVVRVPVGPATRWTPTPELLEAAGPLTGVVLASPSNPTGTVLDHDAIAALVHWASERHVQLVVDEIYHGLTYGTSAASVLSHTDDAVVVNSFSKYFSMTGWRLGWMTVPEAMVDPVERLQQNLYICAPHISQVAGLAALDAHDELSVHVTRYAAQRQLLLDGLAAAGLSEVAPADGAFYIYGDVSDVLEASGVADSMTLCQRWLTELGVACTPGVDFDLQRGTRTVRWSYAGSADELQAAVDLIHDWTREHCS